MTDTGHNPYEPLRRLLLRRREVIADRAFYERDPEGHLAALREVSEAIVAEGDRLEAEGLSRGRLRHFLAQCSYDKALSWIEAGAQE